MRLPARALSLPTPPRPVFVPPPRSQSSLSRRSRSHGGSIAGASSTDRGRSFGDPVEVTDAPEEIDANGDARPKVAVGRDGEVFVAWTRRGVKPYTGDIRFARSTNGGLSFSRPRTINDDGLAPGHRFESIGVNQRGELFMVWIDKRDLEVAVDAGDSCDGAALYYTWSTDSGATFAPN